MERNFQDALAVVKNIFTNPKLVPGGGAIEMEMSQKLNDYAKSVEGLEQLPLRAGKYTRRK
jgi:T-complex protein 1 subunit gamma